MQQCEMHKFYAVSTKFWGLLAAQNAPREAHRGSTVADRKDTQICKKCGYF